MVDTLGLLDCCAESFQPTQHGWSMLVLSLINRLYHLAARVHGVLHANSNKKAAARQSLLHNNKADHEQPEKQHHILSHQPSDALVHVAVYGSALGSHEKPASSLQRLLLHALHDRHSRSWRHSQHVENTTALFLASSTLPYCARVSSAPSQSLVKESRQCPPNSADEQTHTPAP
jgi:hypothetical protein